MLGRYDRAMRARQPVGGQTLLARAIAAIRRNNGALFYVPANFAGSWTDSAGTDPVNEIADVIRRMTDRTGGSAVATCAGLANKPTVQVNAQGGYVMRFDGRNDNLTTNITTGNEGWVCAGVTFGGEASALETVFHSGGGGELKKGVWIARVGSASTNAIWCGVADGTSRTIAQQTTVSLKSGPVVVDAGWTATSVFAAVNGLPGTTVARSGDATPPNNLAVMGAVSGPSSLLDGPMTAQVICPVLPSAADRAIIRKWIGSLQGQSL